MKKNVTTTHDKNSAEREIILREIISKLLDTDILMGAEQKVLKEYLVYRKSPLEIAVLFSLTPLRVKQIINNAFAIIKSKLSANGKLFYTIRKQQEQIEKFKYDIELKKQNESIFKSLPEETRKLLSEKIETASFDARAKNACIRNKIATFRDLVRLSKREFSCIRDIGQKSIRETETFLQSKGLDWGMNV